MRRYFRNTANKRNGFTFAETLFSLFCITVVMVAIFSVITFMRNVAVSVEMSAIMETHLISIAESISQDLEDDVDITSVDYADDPRIAVDGISSTITVYMQEDVFGEPIYQVIVDSVASAASVRQVTRFFLREGC